MISASLPTDKQKDTVIFICQILSNLLQPVWMFRYDSLHKYIFLIAGREESLEITIFENGSWEFNQDDEA
ncbi:DUF6888 family protein [Aulosira sp. FACHB-615]|uniref:DUF6888 family protein n=1 Tax=Aulosira sp. FACHB-615 TaxID=2692777 RepID=UPI0028C4CC2B|nr:hypothetical protein [Aulosira sp. FACHB-615]